jgi:hypothetical protein
MARRVLAEREEARFPRADHGAPNATLMELREALPTTAALSPLWRAMRRRGLTLKKPYTTPA